ncbi:hypothetical protein AB4Z46_30650 [Variovorax sp. M-6]|uniref:hypothetical protein n=1 Tax=Variovorax sp. M-6 TaxID=3233041 RepID=UPI003F984DF9
MSLGVETLRRLQGASISATYQGYKHATVTVSSQRETLQMQLSALQTQLGATCFELGTPQGIPLDDRLNIQLDGPGPKIVVGVVDDGCPFAHKHRRHFDSAPNALAVRFIWDQGGKAVPPPQPAPFSYGRFFVNDELKAIVASATVNGTVNEDSAYRQSELPSLRSVTSHGAQVMSLAAGWKSRTTPRPRAFAAAPLPAASVPAGRKDMAFVQLPTLALDDPSGMWLDHYALDGIQAIRSYARDVYKNGKARKVIVNLSYGPQTGPHDGSSILETAMKEIIEKAPTDIDPYELQIVLPTGNNHLQRTHAEFDLDKGGGEIQWCVAPDSQVPAYLEIWLPSGVPFSHLRAALISPRGEVVRVKYCTITETDDKTAGTIALPTCQYADRKVILMAIMPTARVPGATPNGFSLAPVGRWKVRLRAKPGVSGKAHAYLARSDPNLGRERRGRSGYLDSKGYDPKRYRRASIQLIDDQPVPSAAVLARGSMSGIAAGTLTYVAASYCATTSMPSLYSSGGPSRPGGRDGPSWAYPADQSVVLQGVLAAGNRSGAVTRLVGTSFAAPMLTRDLWMNPPLPPSALPAVNPWPPWMLHRFGNGLRE